MSQITESDLLRLSMMLENNGQTTLNKYLCKLAEFVLFDSEKDELTSVQICQTINDRFLLQFDLLEVEQAIYLKGKGRIRCNNKRYRLEPKVINQLSNNISATDQLKKYVNLFIKINDLDVEEDSLLQLILSFLYYSFNSNVVNFTNIIGSAPIVNVTDETDVFSPTNEEIKLINSFISWENDEKNKLFYSIVSSSYEYCLLTTKKNPNISQKFFKGKKFYLDTNIIFRIAGINKDDRQFVIKSFVDKCHEVGITLCYTNEVFDEIYRVIDGQINYIKAITQGQPPVNSDIVEKINPSFEINDFYILYCRWCKEPQNKYNDYFSFRGFLLKMIFKAIESFEMVNIQNYKSKCDSSRYTALLESLKQYKNEKRPFRPTSDGSVKTDVNNILYVESLRNKNSKNLWQINDYLVTADQILTSWSKNEFAGIPTVMIPSIWLSIILKISGRTSNDDYKSYCMFMTLRQHRTQEDEIIINPVYLLSRLAQKTIDTEIKEKVINEIMSNQNFYSFENEIQIDETIDKAFDVILSKEKNLIKSELEQEAREEAIRHKKEIDEFEKKLSEQKTGEDYAKKYAENKAQRKIDWYLNHEQIRLLFVGVFILIAVFIVVVYLFKLQPFYNLLSSICDVNHIKNQIFSVITWFFTALTGAISAYFSAVWNYLGSDKRKNKLYSKYLKEQLKHIDI